MCAIKVGSGLLEKKSSRYGLTKFRVDKKFKVMYKMRRAFPWDEVENDFIVTVLRKWSIVLIWFDQI